MPTAQSSATGKTATRRTKNDAIKLLTADHAKVKKMFKEFEKLSKKKDEEGKQELVAQICEELTIHAQLEEEIFYPAAREAIEDDEMMNEAVVEHNSAKELISQIQSMEPSIRCLTPPSRYWVSMSTTTSKKSRMKYFPRSKKQNLIWKKSARKSRSERRSCRRN